MTPEALKTEIVKKLEHVNEGWILKPISKLLSDVPAKPIHKDSPATGPAFSYYLGNIQDKVDLEKIRREHPRKPLDKEVFKKKVEALEWDQSLEELLEDLK